MKKPFLPIPTTSVHAKNQVSRSKGKGASPWTDTHTRGHNSLICNVSMAIFRFSSLRVIWRHQTENDVITVKIGQNPKMFLVPPLDFNSIQSFIRHLAKYIQYNTGWPKKNRPCLRILSHDSNIQLLCCDTSKWISRTSILQIWKPF